jgi:homoserine O-acetyltransferase
MRPVLFSLMFTMAMGAAHAADYPVPVQGDATLRNFTFASGATLPALRIHYRTLGTPQRDSRGVVTNAVLITHGTGGTGAQFLRPDFAGELFGPKGLLDAQRYYIILTDGIGHGQSSKPSDGLHARFPHYGYRDMVDAQKQVLEQLGVNHLRLVMGTSMGGMQAWVWGERYPGFMDALMPLASLPTQIAGRNRAWRRVVIDAIRNDPQWQGGDYRVQPQSLRTGLQMLYFMGSNPALRQQQTPTLAGTDTALDAYVAAGFKDTDATDLVYQLEASLDYDPLPDLEKIRVPLVAVNTADDMINPPELGILEREIKRVPQGSAVVLPFSADTRGHGSHTVANLWKPYLQRVLQASEKRAP